MQLTAEQKNLRIFLDFKNDSTYYLDPTTSTETKGIVYENGNIYIGAKYLTDDVKKYEVLGALIHELCHLAVYIAFMNNFDPYPVGQNDNRKRFKGIVMTQCKDFKNSEKLIKNVFHSYKEKIQDSEMIVTVPQMMMQYLLDPTKLAELNRTFKELFDYMSDIVEPEFTNALKVIKKLNHEDIAINFTDLSVPMKAKILNMEIDFQGAAICLEEIIGNNVEALKHLTSENIRNILLKNHKLQISSSHKLDKNQVVIERNFIDINGTKKNASSIFEYSHVFILADNAGSGKTTTLKNLTDNLKGDFKNYWVSYINLRKYSNIFDEYNKNVMDLQLQQVFEILLKIIKQISSQNDNDQENFDFEQNIFIELFGTDKAILLLDAVDEVCPKYRKLLMRIFEIFQENNIKNRLCISTRKHHTAQLESIFHTYAHKFAPCDEEDIKKLITIVLRKQKVKYIERSVSNVLQLIGEIDQKMQISSNQMAENLLLIQIITEIWVNGESFIYSGSEYNFFSTVVEQQKKKLGPKVENNECDKDSKLNIWDVHIVFALFVIIFNQFGTEIGVNFDDLTIVKKWKSEIGNSGDWMTNAEEPKTSLTNLQETGKRQKLLNTQKLLVKSTQDSVWTSDLIQRYGYAIIDENLSKSSIDFTHNLYAEFFVAKFIIQSISDESDLGDEEITKIFKILNFIMRSKFDLSRVRNFILSYMLRDWSKRQLMFHKKVIDLLMNEIPNIHQDILDGEMKLFIDYSTFYDNDLELSLKFYSTNCISDNHSFQNKFKSRTFRSPKGIQKNIIIGEFDGDNCFFYICIKTLGSKILEQLEGSMKYLLDEEEIQELCTIDLHEEDEKLLKFWIYAQINEDKKPQFENPHYRCHLKYKMFLKSFEVIKRTSPSQMLAVSYSQKKLCMSHMCEVFVAKIMKLIEDALVIDHESIKQLILNDIAKQKFSNEELFVETEMRASNSPTRIVLPPNYFFPFKW